MPVNTPRMRTEVDTGIHRLLTKSGSVPNPELNASAWAPIADFYLYHRRRRSGRLPLRFPLFYTPLNAILSLLITLKTLFIHIIICNSGLLSSLAYSHTSCLPELGPPSAVSTTLASRTRGPLLDVANVGRPFQVCFCIEIVLFWLHGLACCQFH